MAVWLPVIIGLATALVMIVASMWWAFRPAGLDRKAPSPATRSHARRDATGSKAPDDKDR